MALAGNPTEIFLDLIATALETAGTANLDLRLFTGAPTLNSGTVYADLTQPVYTGYLPAAMTIGVRRGNANGDIILPCGMASFQATADPGSPITVTGAMLVQGSGTPDLWLAELLDDPWILSSTANALDIVYEVYVTANPTYGGVCTTCQN